MAELALFQRVKTYKGVIGSILEYIHTL